MNPNQLWIDQLKQIREEKIISIMDQCRYLGITFMTFKRFIDPKRTTPLSCPTLRKIKAYLEKELDGQDKSTGDMYRTS